MNHDLFNRKGQFQFTEQFIGHYVAYCMSQSATLPSYLAEGQFYMRKLLLECLIHVFLQVRWFYILNNRRLQKDKETFVVDVINVHMQLFLG